MEKIYSALLAMALATAPAIADSGYRSLVVSQHDGSKVAVNLTDDLSAQFVDGMFVVTGSEADLSVEQSKIASFEFLTTTGIHDAAVDGSAAPVVSGGSLLLTALPAGSSVAVYAVSGTKVAGAELPAGGDYSLPLATLAPGVYLVNVNGVTYKIATRK